MRVRIFCNLHGLKYFEAEINKFIKNIEHETYVPGDGNIYNGTILDIKYLECDDEMYACVHYKEAKDV